MRPSPLIRTVASVSPAHPGGLGCPQLLESREKRMWPARSTGTSSTVSRVHPPPRPHLP